MDIDLLRTFLEVRRLGNFRSAAENLHVTQAAVSQRIKHLESILNTSLFVREKNNISVTEAGEQLLPAAESIVATWAGVQHEIGQRDISGVTFTAAASAGLWELAGHGCLASLGAHAPGTSFKADVAGEDVIRKRLLQQTLDLGLLRVPTDLDVLHCKAVMSFELALHSNRAKNLEHARREPYVYVEWGPHVATFCKAELGIDSRPVLRTADFLIAQRFIEQNGGSALLPVGWSSVKSKVREIPGSPRVRCAVFAAWHKRNPQQALIDEVFKSSAATQ